MSKQERGHAPKGTPVVSAATVSGRFASGGLFLRRRLLSEASRTAVAENCSSWHELQRRIWGK
jgi:hypothetical protein